MTATIYALASVPGAAGVAIVRVSGPGAAESLTTLTRQKVPPPRQAVLRLLCSPETGAPIDRALVLFFRGPQSFTGEDVAEYHLHGGRAVIDAVLAALAVQPGHRLAAPGEFTRRAFENGKLDLTAAEAVADLIAAETEEQRVQALAQMGGALADLYGGWAVRLTRALAHIEADIDFPDEDLPGGVAAAVRPDLDAVLAAIENHLNDGHRGERLREGIRIAVIGAPNAGKSSLVNALARREVAIVSPLPGTTRDVIEAHLNIGGYPVILSDTAGLRPEQIDERAGGHDAIEAEGIRRALRAAREADIKMLVFDAAAGLDEATARLQDERSLIVENKADQAKSARPDVIRVSSTTGEGIENIIQSLIEKIKTIFGAQQSQGPSLTRARHRAALEECAVSLHRARAASVPELAAEDVRLALRALGRITGRVDVEDLLDVIFRDFCIGK